MAAAQEKELIIYAADNKFSFFNDEKERQWKEEFSFIQAADTQYGMMDGIKKGRTGDEWDEEIALTTLAVKGINNMKPKPKFVAICGDLTDAFPGKCAYFKEEVILNFVQQMSSKDYPEMKSRQIADLKRVLADLDKEIPLVCVCGNHDIGNTPTKETIASYRSSYGCDYFSFWCSGVFFIVLNSQYFWDSSKVEDLAAEHEMWLDKQLDAIKSSACKHAVVFQHIPYFLTNPDEGDNGIFSFLPEFRKKMLEKLSNAGVNAIFCGHYHRNAGGFFGSVEQVVTSAIGAQLGHDPHGLRLVKVYQDKIQHEYYDLTQLPSDIIF